jgi:hypothetical protein
MIPSQTNRTVEGTLQGEKVAMSVDQKHMAHVMNILIRQYSNPRYAVIREYSNNAYDSHVEAGQTRPIEVTTPETHLSAPFLTIRDWGVGLSVDDIHELYSKYGASTKRDSNEGTGMFGIGSKAGLAYAAQFTLQAVKDGVKLTAAVSREEDGSGSMTIVDTSTTDEPNGVEVTIPVKAGDADPIRTEAETFFSYWPKGTVLLNGKEPRHYLEDEHMRLTDDMILRKVNRYSGSQSTIIMGKVPYPSGDDLNADSLGLPPGYSLVCEVPIGTLDIAPSREQLEFTATTKRALESLKTQVRKNLIAAVEREIDQAGSPADAVKMVNKWARILGRHKPTSFRYKSTTIPTSIERPYDKRMLMTGSDNYRLASASNVPSVSLDHLTGAVWVTGYTMSKLTPTHKKKMRMWMHEREAEAEKKGSSFHVTRFMLVDFALDTRWIEPERVVAWDTINALQLPKAIRGASGRLPGSYDVIAKGKTALSHHGAGGRGTFDRGASLWEVPGGKIAMDKPVFYIHGNVASALYYSPMFDHMPDYTIICLPANRIGKFTRENPAIKSVHAVLKDQYNEWEAKLTKDQRAALAQADQGDRSRLMELAPHAIKIKDPAVREGIRLAKVPVDDLVKARRQFQRILTSLPPLASVPDYADPMDRYHLFYSYELRRNLQHTINYMNACYEGGW